MVVLMHSVTRGALASLKRMTWAATFLRPFSQSMGILTLRDNLLSSLKSAS